MTRTRSLPWWSVLVVLLAACGPERRPEEEPPEILEHRLPACSKWCAAKFECGNHGVGEHGLEDEPSCIEACAITTSNIVGFGYQGDGVDACVPEFNAYADCVEALSCEDQARHFGVIEPAVQPLDRPCGDELGTTLYCSVDHPYRG